jgi:tetratricopeptide (TPR) repeat protein
MPAVSLILALLLQVGPNPLLGGITGDDLVRDRPPRAGQRQDSPRHPSSRWLESCFDLIAQDPARAHTMAQIRRNETTGADRVLANHCLGTAATALERWEDARAAFRAAHDETPATEARTRARFSVLAGNAALAAGDPAGALVLLVEAGSEARAAGSTVLEALAAIDSARALVRLGQEEEALEALETATRLAPANSEGWLLKATLLRRLERLELAEEAIATAAKLAPADPEIGLEAGVIAVLAGDDEAARARWQAVLALAPESPEAAIAKDYLTQLGPPTPAPGKEPSQ